MNCDVSTLRVDSAFTPGSCSPYGSLGHITNCSQLALECYTGFITSSARDASADQVYYRGSIRDNLEFTQCAERVLGANATWDRAFVSNTACEVSLPGATYNTTSINTSTNSARSSRGKASLLAVVLCVVVCVSMLSTVSATSFTDFPQARWEKRTLGCRTFNLALSTQTQTFSSSTRLSSTVDCRTSTQPCALPAGPFSLTVRSTWSSRDAGSGTDLPTNGIPTNLYVAAASASLANATLYVTPGQAGFLAGYAPATLFRGNLTDCDGGGEREVELLVVKRESVRFNVVTTSS